MVFSRCKEDFATRPGVQTIGRLSRKSIGQRVFRWTVLAWETLVICSIVLMLGKYSCKWLDSAVSSCQNVLQCSFKMSNSWRVLCPTVQWMVNAASNCLMAGGLSVQQSHGQTVLCPTIKWLDVTVSNYPKVRLCSVKLSNYYLFQGLTYIAL